LQPCNTGQFRWWAYTKPIDGIGKEAKYQIKPSLLLQAERYNQYNKLKQDKLKLDGQ